MRGLRCPDDEYALPAMPPGKKQVENQRKERRIHKRESCCNPRSMSTTPCIVAIVTKHVTSRALDNLFNGRALAVPPIAEDATPTTVADVSLTGTFGSCTSWRRAPNRVLDSRNNLVRRSRNICFAGDWPSVTHVLFLRARSRGTQNS